jgi:ribosome biogenesis GTPase
MSEENFEGLVVKSQSGFFEVKIAESSSVTCELRGRLKQGARTGDIIAVGDRVRITALPEGTGMIEEVLPRERAIVRMDPRPRGVYRQILLANPDQAVFVFACAKPRPRLRMLDRFLVIAEQQQIPTVIVANKVELIGRDEAEALFGHYAKIGYQVLYTSAVEEVGIEELRQTLKGKLSAFAGPSGVGKSSLLNAMQPGLGIAVSEISESLDRGKHTTAHRELHPLNEGGYVADTPGWKSLALWDTEPEELDGYFPDIAPLVAQCRFSDCSHVHEPGCGVLTGLKNGELHEERFDSFLRMRDGLSNRR